MFAFRFWFASATMSNVTFGCCRVNSSPSCLTASPDSVLVMIWILTGSEGRAVDTAAAAVLALPLVLAAPGGAHAVSARAAITPAPRTRE
ncbi:hypothetical protein CELD12_24340 [Cellulomonas sp. NTE-D12]|nr:hypothetical protein CELD12_24340 [Cellulomonas sp. NTE-D12]